MTDLQHHYKERTPEQTVQIIKNFFKDNNLTLIESDLNQAESGTWYVHVDIFANNIKLGGTNGKGMTQEYALASGYAELYERFCNKIFYFNSYIWTKSYMEANKQKNGFYFHKDEKILTRDEVLNTSKRVRTYFDKIAQNIPELENAALEFITDNKFIGVPMKNIADDNDLLYIDPRLLMRVTRSNGMAAGNTLEEALNQGLSEIIEREAEYKFFMSLSNMNDIKYSAINLDKIDNPNLINIINNIKELGYDFYIFDLSYLYNMPTVMSLLVDHQNGIMNINFGAFPVFDIAAERVLTELYQGIKSYKNSNFKYRLQTPFRSINFNDIMQLYGNAISGEVFPFEFFDHITYVDSYNTDVFISKNSSNKQILQFFKDFTIKYPDIKFYYLDNSLLPDLYAVHILLENTDNYYPMSACNNFNILWNDITVQQAIQRLTTLKNLYLSIYNNTNADIPALINLIQSQWELDPSIFTFLDACCLWNQIFIINKEASYDVFSPLIDWFNGIGIPGEIVDNEICANYKKYKQLLIYVLTGQYSYQELLHIFNDIFNYNITDNDIYNVTNIGFLLKRVYVDSLIEFINSDSYKQLINTYINNNLS